MRYRNVITRVCRESCISLNGSKCLLHDSKLEKIKINDSYYFVVSKNCIYKKNVNMDDSTTPLFDEEIIV